jgi:hypothetical protein
MDFAHNIPSTKQFGLTPHQNTKAPEETLELLRGQIWVPFGLPFHTSLQKVEVRLEG